MTDTDIGRSLYISRVPAALPNSEASYQPLTWVKVPGVVSVGIVGFQHNLIDIPDLETGNMLKAKGARAGQPVNISFLYIDELQMALLDETSDQLTECSILLHKPGARAIYMTGMLYSAIENEANTTSFEGSSIQFVPNYDIIRKMSWDVGDLFIGGQDGFAAGGFTLAE